jgi:hypothetical protein
MFKILKLCFSNKKKIFLIFSPPPIKFGCDFRPTFRIFFIFKKKQKKIQNQISNQIKLKQIKLNFYFLFFKWFWICFFGSNLIRNKKKRVVMGQYGLGERRLEYTVNAIVFIRL